MKDRWQALSDRVHKQMEERKTRKQKEREEQKRQDREEQERDDRERRRREERERRHREARRAYEHALTSVDLHETPEVNTRTITDVRNDAPADLTPETRADLERARGVALVKHALGDPEHIDGYGLHTLGAVLQELCGEDFYSDWVYEEVNLARLIHGMWPFARYKQDLVLHANERLLLVEEILLEFDDFYQDPETGEQIPIPGERALGLEVTSKRLALITDSARVIGLEHVQAVTALSGDENPAESRISLTISELRAPMIMRSPVAHLIAETIKHAGYEFHRERPETAE